MNEQRRMAENLCEGREAKEMRYQRNDTLLGGRGFLMPLGALAVLALLVLAAPAGAQSQRRAGAGEVLLISDELFGASVDIERSSGSGGSDSGASGGNDGSSSGGSDGSGSSDDDGVADSGGGGNDKNKSGLGDGTNPGQGGGKDNAKNNGTNNPNNARK